MPNGTLRQWRAGGEATAVDLTGENVMVDMSSCVMKISAVPRIENLRGLIAKVDAGLELCVLASTPILRTPLPLSQMKVRVPNRQG